MALSVDAKEQFLNAGSRLQELAGESLKDLLEDVRWFTTLVLASIGGLGAYRELQEAKSLSLPFAIVVLLLCLTLFVLLLTVLTATEMKRRFGHDIHGFNDRVLKIAHDDSLAPRDGERLLEEDLTSLRRRHSTIVEHPQILQFIGIAAFIVAALIGVIFVLFSEVLVAIFGGA